MDSLKLLLIGGTEFLKGIFRKVDRNSDQCQRGHSVPQEWDHCFECRIIDQILKSQEREREIQPYLYLYCYLGIHQGEVITLKNPCTKIGYDAQSDLCLTPDKGKWGQACILNQDTILISSPNETPVTVNQVQSYREHLVDYDHLELLGNRFLVLTHPQQETLS